ncbi:MAG: hypothetical protein RSD81_20785 [Pseudomonas sp.]
MNRTLLLLNALALAVLAGFILQPEASAIASRTPVASEMNTQSEALDTATGRISAAVQSSSLRPASEQRLVF